MNSSSVPFVVKDKRYFTNFKEGGQENERRFLRSLCFFFYLVTSNKFEPNPP